MSRKSKWITPFVKQSFVTSGVTLNLAGHGICNGFAAILLPQLKAPDSPIPIDDSSGSWIGKYSTIIIKTLSSPLPYPTSVGSARQVFVLQVTLSSVISVITPFLIMSPFTQSIQKIKDPVSNKSFFLTVSVSGFALVIGNFIIPVIMGKYGRRIANMASLVPMILGWVGIILATNIPMLIVSRLLQGLSMGMGTTLGPVLIGEYTSPKNRGAFLTVISVMISVGVLVVHTLGSYLHWQTTAVYCTFISIADFIIVLLSPESPSWLADRGKYDESKKVFRWLRGDGEEHELERLIKTRLDEEIKIGVKETKSVLTTLKHRKVYLKSLFKRKEFYKPIIIMVHIYTLSQWAGVNILITYTVDLLDRVVGKNVDLALLIITLDSQRIISNIIGVYFIKKKRRRSMLMVTGLLAITAMLATALYSYLKQQDVVDHPLIGILLLHFHMLTVGFGSLPICYIIAGELFPLEFRSIAGGISVLFHSTSFFIIVKTVPFLFKTIGLHGAYCLYSFVVIYCLLVSWKLLPETKDKTLQEIEDEFRGVSENEKTIELLPMESTV